VASGLHAAAQLGHRAAEFTALAHQLSTPGAPTFVGSRHFWRSDYSAHHRPAAFQSLRMKSTRTNGNQECNGENIRPWHTSDGALYTYRYVLLAQLLLLLLTAVALGLAVALADVPCSDGDEYSAIFPVWDWDAIPGTTGRAGPLPGEKPGKDLDQPGKTAFVGGASDGKHTLTVMDFVGDDDGAAGEKKATVRAHKSWAFVDEGVLALVQNVSLLSPQGAEVITSLEQSLLRGKVQCSSGAIKPGMKHPEKLPSGASWCWHNQILYAWKGAGLRASVLAGRVTGSWSRISQAQSAAPVTKDVFKLLVSHGAAPLSSKDMMYAALPGVQLADAPKVATAFWSDTLGAVKNDATAQAVLIPGKQGKPSRLMGSLWQPGGSMAAKAEGFPLDVSADAMVALQLLLDKAGGTLGVVLAVPAANATTTVKLTIGGVKVVAGDGGKGVKCTEQGVEVTTKGGYYAAQSVLGSCKLD